MHNEVTYSRLRSLLAIDSMQLDKELMEQPQLLSDILDQVSYAQGRFDEATSEQKIATAIAAGELRDELVNGKPRSEATITSEVQLNTAVAESRSLVNDTNLELSLWKSLADGARAKGDSLKGLTSLTVSGYLAPSSAYEARRAEMSAVRNAKRTPAQPN